MAPVALIERVEAAAQGFGIGRGIHLGETILGIKGRVAFEAPAAEVLLTAHRELEKLVLTGRQVRMKETVAAVYGDLVHEGQHLDPVCRDIEALLALLAGAGDGRGLPPLPARAGVRRGGGVAALAARRLARRLRRGGRGVVGGGRARLLAGSWRCRASCMRPHGGHAAGGQGAGR